jgi:3-dehydroquinate dehydratase-1
MRLNSLSLTADRRHVIGSVGSARALADTSPATARAACDMVEIRLDALAAAGLALGPTLWRHLSEVPLLFTARRKDEGGALDAPPETRMAWLRAALDDATAIDVELASAAEMRPLLDEAAARGIPWVASFHDFNELPDTARMTALAQQASAAGARVFKLAAHLPQRADLLRLADFQAAGHHLPLATMGMGPLAAVSRLLCAQCGSLLNYGFLGDTPTAPGQWHCDLLRRALAGF